MKAPLPISFAVAFLALASPVFSQAPAPYRISTPFPRNGEVATTWPGVKFEIGKIVRLDAGHVLMAIRLVGDPNVKNPTPLGAPVALPPVSDEPATNADAVAGRPILEPMSLTSAYVIDPKNKARFNADGDLPPKPSYGMNTVIAFMHPNTWFQMSVKFSLPEPPPTGDETKLPIQRVDVVLPHAKGPIRDVVIPPVSQ